MLPGGSEQAGLAEEQMTGREPVASDKRVVVTALGTIQILNWGSTYYLPTVLAQPIALDTGWPLPWVVGALSLGLLVAGLTAPYVGRAIAERGGRPVLTTSSVLLVVGMLILAAAPSLVVFVAGWLIIGVAMAAGLYDAAFSTLGRLYGTEARQPIAAITLFGGLASTMCWPLSAFMTTELGWRGACLVYAALHLLIALPTHLFLLPRQKEQPIQGPQAVSSHDSGIPLLPLVLLATTISLATAVSGVISVHLLTLLQARDIALAAAVGLGALIGPSQVAARIVEIIIGRYHHPIWTMVASVLLIAIGLALLFSSSAVLPLALMLYGAGIGIHSIARGTLPLSLFGSERYAIVMGRIARPSLLVGAASPTVGALLLEYAGTDTTLAVLVTLAVLNMALVALIVAMRGESNPS
jgi:MFS family permease